MNRFPGLFRFLIHVGFSGAFLALPYVFAPGGFGRLADVRTNPHERSNLLAYGLMLAFFYVNYYVLIPRLYFNRRYAPYTAGVAGCFGAILGLLLLVDRVNFLLPGLAPPRPLRTAMDRPPLPRLPADELRSFGRPPIGVAGGKPPVGFEVSHALFLFLAGTFGSLALRTISHLRQIEQEKAETELAFLKAQINPHFLFNTLNTLYALAIEGSDHTADAIVRLSSLMRFVIRDAGADRVPLTKEFEYITDYVALQQLRLGDTVRVDFVVEGRPAGQTIAPLLLLSFIENAFKYGVNPARPSVITIRLALAGDTLRLLVQNGKVRAQPVASSGMPNHTVPDEATGGIGIANTRARLNLLYPNRYVLTIRDEADQFIVDLTLTLT